MEPRIDGLGINPVNLSDGTVALVVVVPRSLRAPHMAKDNKFYKRFNFESVPMQHYEVEDVRRREGSPRLSVLPHMTTGTPEDYNGMPMLSMRLMVSIKNESRTPAMYALIEALFEMEVKAEDADGWKKGTLYTFTDGTHDMHGRAYNWSVIKNLPVWEGQEQSIDPQLYLKIPLWNGDRDYDFKLRVSAPGMPQKETSYKIRVFHRAAKIIPIGDAEVHDCEGHSEGPAPEEVQT